MDFSWIFNGFFSLGALGAWIYQVAFMPRNDCFIIQELEDIPLMNMATLKSTPNVQIQRDFTEQEQQEAMYSEVKLFIL
jgi:hypothetical protein